MNTVPRPHVLVAEDHAPLRLQIVRLLESAGLQVDEAADGRLALHSVLAQPPDLLVLDLGLPGLDGLQLCQQLRRRAPRHVPVLMLTARDTLADKLSGFDAGADDYLVKPFASEELLVRVQALLRRRTLGQDYLLHVGPLAIDRRAQQARRSGQLLALPPKAFAILLLLAEAWPRALTRSEITHRLWDDEPPESDPLRSHLYLLRQQLDRPFDWPMLHTVHGVGFRLRVEAAGGPGGPGGPDRPARPDRVDHADAADGTSDADRPGHAGPSQRAGPAGGQGP